MTTDLFFMPTLPPKRLSAWQPDKASSVSTAPVSKNASPDSTKGADRETFLTTLRHASRDHNRSDGSHRQAPRSADRLDPEKRHAKDEGRCDNDPVDGEPAGDAITLLGNDEAALPDEKQVAANLDRLMEWLEKLGLKVSSGAYSSLHGAPWAGNQISTPAERVLDRLAALKQLLGDIQSSDLRPGKEMAAGLERLRQLIARAMDAGRSDQDQSVLTKGFHQAQENVVGINGAVAGAGTAGEKQAEIQSILARIATGVDNASKTPAAIKPVETSGIPPASEGAEKQNAAHLISSIRAGAEAVADARDNKAGPTLPDSELANGARTEMTGKSGIAKNNGDLSRLISTADKGSRSDGQTPVENSLAGDTSPVSKLINDAQVEKQNPLKADLGAGGDAGSKVVKLEAGTNDGGQLASQGQAFEKALENTSSTKEAEAAPRELRTQTMEQIVRRAVIQVRDGQHEARIELKPDFLGHVRLQVITANQQVTVKILTEFGFVKDMIENSIQQLKAELQQQGLEVDKVDVSVSRDSQGNKHPQENMEHAGSRHRGAETNDRGNEREEQPDRPQRPSLRAEGHATVDFFA